jgi:hypothetical protein
MPGVESIMFMPVPAHKHQLRSRAWIGLDRVQKDLGEYFYRDKVGLVTRRRLMSFEGSGRNERGYAVGNRARVARVEARRIEVRIHGEWWMWVLVDFRDSMRIDRAHSGDGRG